MSADRFRAGLVTLHTDMVFAYVFSPTRIRLDTYAKELDITNALRLRDWLDEALFRTQTLQRAGYVKIPQSIEEAQAMISIGISWLEANAPHQLLTKQAD